MHRHLKPPVVTPILEEQGLAQYFDFIGGASMDESRDTKTEVVRYVARQPPCRASGCWWWATQRDDMRALPTVVWMLPVCCTATAAGKSWKLSIRCCWPKAAPTLPTGCWQPGYDRKFHSFGRRMDRI